MRLPVFPDPATVSCNGCGSCCRHMRTPPIATPEDISRVPINLLREIHDYLDTVTGDEQIPCLWFDMATMQCKHYESRPQVCREYEVAGPSCLLFRVAHSKASAGEEDMTRLWAKDEDILRMKGV